MSIEKNGFDEKKMESSKEMYDEYENLLIEYLESKNVGFGNDEIKALSQKLINKIQTENLKPL